MLHGKWILWVGVVQSGSRETRHLLIQARDGDGVLVTNATVANYCKFSSLKPDKFIPYSSGYQKSDMGLTG